MSVEDYIKDSVQSKPVPEDKFDSHMEKARRDDISSRRSIFCQQSQNGIDKRESRKTLKTSIY